MSSLLTKLKALQNSKVKSLVDNRIKEFKLIGEKDTHRWFSELCFCILTANCSANKCMDIQEDLGVDGFLKLPKSDLIERLRDLGYRFYRIRADYIVSAREYSDELKNIINDFTDSYKARDWLVENVKGLGYKESSHFMRNVGFSNLMILDRHILRTAREGGIIDSIPSNLNRKRYLDIESKIDLLADKVSLSLAEIDLYLWYIATGKILK